ncbi:hypothetical protein E2C01_039751 [Portunus trituberculatus]|uniref:Uncharacterized protein n=1 Tax=Portunus trituberculatus TaxID=210409 RepID=A0A5B7FHT8_PORTR|nr:hypothetical protein [Portunus trituberculatus]
MSLHHITKELLRNPLTATQLLSHSKAFTDLDPDPDLDLDPSQTAPGRPSAPSTMPEQCLALQ